jgi:hypothetical protein
MAGLFILRQVSKRSQNYVLLKYSNSSNKRNDIRPLKWPLLAPDVRLCQFIGFGWGWFAGGKVRKPKSHFS